MINIYKLDELKDINITAYLKAIKTLRADIGGSSDEAIIRYCNQAGIYASNKGLIYKER